MENEKQKVTPSAKLPSRRRRTDNRAEGKVITEEKTLKNNPKKRGGKGEGPRREKNVRTPSPEVSVAVKKSRRRAPIERPSCRLLVQKPKENRNRQNAAIAGNIA